MGHAAHTASPRRKPALICFVGALPPPTYGMANVNAVMVDALAERTCVRRISISAGVARGPLRHAKKLGRVMLALAGMVRARIAGAQVFYGSVDDRIGGIYTAAVAALARLLGMRIYLHHHSFAYIDRRTVPMRAIAAFAGPGATHIVLCDSMGVRLQEVYPSIRRTIAVANAVPVPQAVSPRTPRGDRAITIGLMSNLTQDKGLGRFVDLVEAARRDGIDVTGILAGPASEAGAEPFIRDAIGRSGGAIAWRGPVSGAEKDRFFADIDLFVFPTTYPSEAYPLVLIEALVRGVPVLSLDRGCIGCLAALSSCTVVGQPDGFNAAGLALLRRWQVRPDSVRDASDAAIREGRALNTANRASRVALIDEMTGGRTAV